MSCGVSINKVGLGQSIGSFGNDLGSFSMTGGTIGAINEMRINNYNLDSRINLMLSSPVYVWGLYNDIPSKNNK